MAQQLRIHIFLPENKSLIISPISGSSKQPVTPALRIQHFLLASMDTLRHVAYIHTYTHTRAHTHTHTHTCKHMCMHIHRDLNTNSYTQYTYTCAHKCAHALHKTHKVHACTQSIPTCTQKDIYMHSCIHTRTHTHNAHTYACIYTDAYTHRCTQYTEAHAFMIVCTHAYKTHSTIHAVYTCMHVCTCTHST